MAAGSTLPASVTPASLPSFDPPMKRMFSFGFPLCPGPGSPVLWPMYSEDLPEALQ